MALYSWFRKNNNELAKKSVQVNNNIVKASESAKYIENYTMWPTAKVKSGVDVKIPVYDDIDNKLSKEPNEIKATLDNKSIPYQAALLGNK